VAYRATIRAKTKYGIDWTNNVVPTTALSSEVPLTCAAIVPARTPTAR
jgi:hypothetical protein